VHEAFKEPLLDLRARTLERLDAGDTAYIEHLRSTWDRETARVPASDFGEEKVPYSKVLAELRGVVRDTRVIIDNYRSKDRLNYEVGPVTAIAVGGSTLSRGLTLEGLV